MGWNISSFFLSFLSWWKTIHRGGEKSKLFSTGEGKRDDSSRSKMGLLKEVEQEVHHRIVNSAFAYHNDIDISTPQDDEFDALVTKVFNNYISDGTISDCDIKSLIHMNKYAKAVLHIRSLKKFKRAHRKNIQQMTESYFIERALSI